MGGGQISCSELCGLRTSSGGGKPTLEIVGDGRTSWIAEVVSASCSSRNGGGGDGGLTSSASSTSRTFDVGGGTRMTGLFCIADVELSGGTDSTCGIEGSFGTGAIGTVKSFESSEPVALSVWTNIWTAEVVVESISLRDGGCISELNLSSLPRSGGSDPSGTGGSEGVNNARGGGGGGGDGGVVCLSNVKSERDTFDIVGCESRFDRRS